MVTNSSTADSGPSSGSSDPASPAALPWPPPGLARVQGDVYTAAAWLGAGAFLILPLLYAVVAEQDTWSPGPLGSTLWLAFLLGVAGIPVLMGGYVMAARLVRRASEAVDQGHEWRMVALVATDHRRDTGFLLQGARAYRLLSGSTRRRLATARIVIGGTLLFGALWLSLGFGLSIVLAARGLLGPWAVVLFTLAPSAALGVVGVVTYAWQEGILRKCRKRWYNQSWSQELVRDEIRAWQAAMATRAPGVPKPEELPENGGRARTTLRASYLAVGVAMVVAFVPVFTLVLSAAITPILAHVAVPRYDRAVERLASLEPLRAYALAPDSSISAREAGAVLHTLSFVGRPYRATEGVLPPARAYPAPWLPQDSLAPDSVPAWVRGIVGRVGGPLSAAERTYLERVAAHPAHGEIGRLARAPALDITGARWSLPLPSAITLDQLSQPDMAQVREGGYAHLARAALEAATGAEAAADTTIREVLSVGLLLADESPALLDNLIGMALVERAGEALESLYRRTGHPDADALAWGLASARRGVDRVRAEAARDVVSRLRTMPESALDSAFVRGVRWEYVGLLNTLGPCINLKRVVFGPGLDYRNWLALVEARLVRYPGEAELFEIARGGLLGRDPDEAPSLPTRLLALTMGDTDQPGSCARVLGEAVGF